MMQGNDENPLEQRELLDSSNKCISKQKKEHALRTARRELGLTQSEVATEIGVDEKTVRRWEAGECLPHPIHVKKLCALFSKTAEQLSLQAHPKVEQNQEDHNICSLKQEEHQKENVSTVVCKSSVSQQNPYQQQLLVAICHFGMAVIIVFAVIQGYQRGFFPSEPSKAIQYHSLCPDDTSTYVVVRTLSRDHCFSGVESMPFFVEDVMSIETNNNIASWRYIRDGKEQRDPVNFDMRLHVCKHLVIKYSPPVRLTRIFIAPRTDGVKCTNNVTSASVK